MRTEQEIRYKIAHIIEWNNLERIGHQWAKGAIASLEWILGLSEIQEPSEPVATYASRPVSDDAFDGIVAETWPRTDPTPDPRLDPATPMYRKDGQVR